MTKDKDVYREGERLEDRRFVSDRYGIIARLTNGPVTIGLINCMGLGFGGRCKFDALTRLICPLSDANSGTVSNV